MCLDRKLNKVKELKRFLSERKAMKWILSGNIGISQEHIFVTDLDNNNLKAFVSIIEMLAQQPLKDRLAIRAKVCEAAKARLSDPKAFIQNRNLYLKE